MQTIQLRFGDCIEVLRTYPDGSIGSLITDPPYLIGFMSKGWDAEGDGGQKAEWHLAWLKEAFRVLRPGGTAKVFSATRTGHRLAAAMEEAGFILVPEHSLEAWSYGCLTEDTEVLTQDGWVHYHRAKVGTLVLGFNVQTGQFDWQPVEETFEYPYDREAFHLIGDGSDHIVSVGHRCVVQRDGGWVIVRAEELAATEVVPSVHWQVHPQEAFAGDVQSFLCQQGTGADEEAFGEAEGPIPRLHRLRDSQVVSRGVDQEGHRTASLLPQVQRGASGAGLGEAWAQGCCCGDTCRSGIRHPEDDGSTQPRLEGRGDVLQEARELRQARADQVHPVPLGVPTDGSQGRVHHGAPADCGPGVGSLLDADRDGTSHEPQPDRQPAGELGAVFIEPSSQVVRASRVPSPHLARVTVRVEPTQYTGTVWCVKVPTGAFVARRNGLAFVTGNSGFPKSLDVGKALDKAAGVERTEVVGISRGVAVADHQGFGGIARGAVGVKQVAVNLPVTAPATEEAKRFKGYGTALKPAWEVFLVGRKVL